MLRSNALESFPRALFINWSLLIPMLYTFPNGKFIPRGTRWLTLIWVGTNLVWLIFPDFPNNPTRRGMLTQPFWFYFYLAWFFSGVVAQVFRYRRSKSLTQKQQTKWVVFGFGIAGRDASGEVLNSLAAKIRDATHGRVNATVINDGSEVKPYRLTLASKIGGADGILSFDTHAIGLETSTLVEGRDAVLMLYRAGPVNQLREHIGAWRSSAARRKGEAPGLELFQENPDPMAVGVSYPGMQVRVMPELRPEECVRQFAEAVAR